MQASIRHLMAFSLAGIMAVSGLVVSPSLSPAAEELSSVQATSCPSVLLKHWKASTRQEKLAFLFGFVSMLEMEKEWQAGRNRSIRDSITPSWVRGLSGKTLGELSDALDGYIAENPDKLDASVLGTLGRMYVAPQLSNAERKEAAARYRQIKANK